ncbi:sodium:alanine symporter family protein [uncultured Cetobacterium sp.]|uniref:alanine/glycine:cation symporter family protein n=1 Tax=uncultured Cetobacterium sp. TaxID=527638 RepID=UPI002619F186|nr:sodium:alanine symporter family protein [uncultured Cetobacterium sp.]
MNLITKLVDSVNGIIWSNNILVALLIGTAIYFTLKTNFMQFRLFKHMFKSVWNKEDDGNGVSSFESFCLGTACRIGAGNIAGVVAAISVGGPGSIFWMWLVALLGCSTSFIESTLSVIYRKKDPSGEFEGGTPWILEKKLNKRWIGVFYAIASIICYIGAIQVMSNSVTESFESAFHINKFLLAGLLSVAVGLTIFGKRNKIINVLNKIVPFMALLYIGVVLIVILKNATLVPLVIKNIFYQAFGGEQIIGGALGGIIMQGVKRGLFSNEAGTGNSNYAAAIADVKHPAKQGLVQAFGVFVDTIVICTATALVVLLAGDQGDLSGMVLFQESLKSHIGWIGIPFTSITIFLFSFSTILGVTFFGRNALSFISKNSILNISYKILIIVMVFQGGIQENQTVWALADLGLGLMAIINIGCILPISKDAIDSLKDYEEKFLKKGKQKNILQNLAEEN